MNMTDIVVTTLSDFFKNNGIDFKCLDSDIRVDNPSGAIEIIPSDSFSYDLNGGKLTICGNIEKDHDHMIEELMKFATTIKVDTAKLANIEFDIWRLKDRYINGNKILQVSIPQYGITCNDRYITCNKRLEIQSIQYKNQIHLVDREKMTELGYGISRWRINNLYEFDGVVFCTGYHPNVQAGMLCMNTPILGDIMTVNTIQAIMTMLSVINLDSYFGSSDHITRIVPFLKIGEQI